MILLINREAVTIDSCYNGGFMAGRIISAFVAAFLLPRSFSSSHFHLLIVMVVYRMSRKKLTF